MIRSALLAAFALATALANAQGQGKLPPHPSETWFSLNRTSSGYIAAGNLAGTLWAFHVRGTEMKQLGGGSRPVFSIDGVVMQVAAVNRSVVKTDGGDLLAAHKRFEQEHQAQSNPTVKFRHHDLCRGAPVPHQQWIAQGKSITQAYVTFEVGDYVLMVVAPYENERRREVVAAAIGEVCRTFQRQKAG